MNKNLLFSLDFGQEVVIEKSGKKGIITRRLITVADYGDSQMTAEKYTVNVEGTSYKLELGVDEIKPADGDEIKNPDKVNYVLTDSQLDAYNVDGDKIHFDTIRGLASEKQGKKEEGSY